MAAGFPLLSLLVLLPLLGIGAILLAARQPDSAGARARGIALGISLAVLLLSLGLWFGFDKTASGFQFEEHLPWIAGTGITYHLGVDGLSVLFVLLTTLMAPICVLACWQASRTGLREYMIALLFLESMLVGVFSAVDLMLFYVFFEASMIPVFLIIGVRGGAGRKAAALKLFLYTMVCMLLMLLAVMILWQDAGSTDLPDLMRLHLSVRTQTWIFLAFLVAFGVKMPMWPIHTWQPAAYAEAPTAGSVMLGGVMLNMGAYGLVRFAIPLLPQAAEALTPLVFTLGTIAVVYASLIALAQRDMKKIVAYSSVAHMGIIMIGLFTANQQGLSGGLLQMLSHGIVSAALFLCVGVLQDRVEARDMDRFGGIAKVMPGFAVVFMLFVMAAVALPGTGDFPGELLVVVGAWKSNPWLSVGISSSMVLGAAYMLYLCRTVLFGRLVREELRGLLDLSLREKTMFAPLMVLTLWIGLYPMSFLSFFQASVFALIQHHEAALATVRAAGL
jgi:NADH-quinone oxidoreductase subunit M